MMTCSLISVCINEVHKQQGEFIICQLSFYRFIPATNGARKKEMWRVGERAAPA